MWSKQYNLLLILLLLITILVNVVVSADFDDSEILLDGVNKGGGVLPENNQLKGDKAAQAATFVFLCLAGLDYVIYFILFLYVFIFVTFESKSILKFLFSTFIVLLFSGIRLLFVPLILNAIPYSWAPKMPLILVEISFYACTISYIIFFNAPVLACLYFVLKFGFRGNKLKGGIVDAKTGKAPMVVIMMPIYNEEPAALFRAVESAIRSDYPSDRLHLLLAFDDASESALYWALMKKLRVLNKDVKEQYKSELENLNLSEDESFLFPPRLELIVEGVRLTICRFPHEGKSATQGKGFRIINEIYSQDQSTIDETLLMYIDSDVILHENALYNFVSTMVSKPHMKAVTGYITCRTSENVNIYHYLQDAEYLEGQMFSRNLEALAGSVTCLPGALTVMKLSAMQNVADKYFKDFDKTAPLHFHRYYLGEDRFMTHLLMEDCEKSHSIGLCGASRCKTDAPDDWRKLCKQRRRWYLGALINEAHMLCTPKLWRTMPLLLCLKLFDYASGSLAWLFMVYVIGVIKGVVPVWTIAVFFPCLLLKFVILSINASYMNRYKVWISFPVFFFVAPIFKLWCTIYSIFTWDTRSWGGPRTDLDEKKVSNSEVMDQLMSRRVQSVKRSRKFLRQMKQKSRIITYNLDYTKDTPSLGDKQMNLNKLESGAATLKNITPFPYGVDILGGGEYFDDLIYPEDLLLHRNLQNTLISTQFTACSTGNSSVDLNHAISLPVLPSDSQTSLGVRSERSTGQPIDAKYIYGKYQRSNPSHTSLSLDLTSLSRMEQLTRPDLDKLNPTDDPATFKYRLSSSLSLSSNQLNRLGALNNSRALSSGSSHASSPLGNSSDVQRSSDSDSSNSPRNIEIPIVTIRRASDS